MDIINTLSGLIDSSAIEATAKQAVDSWSLENDQDGELLSDSELDFHSHKLCFESPLIDYPYFESTYRLINGGEDIGLYKVITSLEGEPLDDYYQLK